MTRHSHDRLVHVVERAYRILLLAYPAEMRRAYGAEMTRVVRDHAQAIIGSRRPYALIGFAWHLLVDSARNSVREHLEVQIAGVIMKTCLALFCVFTVLAGVWLGVMEFVLRHEGFERRILTAVLIVLQSGVTLIVVSGWLGRAGRIAAGLGACFLLAAGVQAFVHDLTSIHFEGYLLIIGAALIVQALLTVWLTLSASTWRSATP
jgi:hypothetical protein